MRKILLLQLLFSAGSLSLIAQTAPTDSAEKLTESPGFRSPDLKPRDDQKMHEEFHADYGYVAGAQAKYGNNSLGNLSSQHGDVRFMVTTPLSERFFLRTGVALDRYSFSLPDGAPLPDTLQSASLNLGLDYKWNEEWMVRGEISPGIYSDFRDVGLSDINVPILLGASYRMNDQVRWFFGFNVNTWSDIPVLPVAGAVWNFADKWKLNLVFPNPRVEYEVRKDLSVFVGGGLSGGTYRVARDFGNQHGQSNLNDALVTYREIKAGAGAEWKINPLLSWQLDGGYLLTRRFEFQRADSQMTGTAAPYVQIGLSSRF